MKLQKNQQKKILVIRMSSMGDLILSTAFLESLSPSIQVDWVVSSEFAFVLQGHPRIDRLLVFNKKEGLRGWLRLLKTLSHQNYDARVDLHVTLRSWFARIYFWISGFKTKSLPWLKISKQRGRHFGLLIFKGLWPQTFLPTPYWQRFAELAKEVEEELAEELNRSSREESIRPPSYLPLLLKQSDGVPALLSRYQLEFKRYYAVTPASKWSSKEWSVENYAALCVSLQASTGFPILLIGRSSDPSSQKLIPLLKERRVHFVSALDEADFKNTALLLQQAVSYIGGDTGLAHLAEAVGTPSVMIFGPTRPTLGFGPWRKESAAIFSDTHCSPCSKDGRICYRFLGPYACLKRIDVERVKRGVPT